MSDDVDVVDDCCCYCKGNIFWANHNTIYKDAYLLKIVVATAKVTFFEQITTYLLKGILDFELLLLLQR